MFVLYWYLRYYFYRNFHTREAIIYIVDCFLKKFFVFIFPLRWIRRSGAAVPACSDITRTGAWGIPPSLFLEQVLGSFLTSFPKICWQPTLWNHSRLILKDCFEKWFQAYFEILEWNYVNNVYNSVSIKYLEIQVNVNFKNYLICLCFNKL